MSQVPVIKGAHHVAQIEYHIVFCPKWREPCMVDYRGVLVYKSILKQCERGQIIVRSLNVQPDHVHLICSIPPKIAVADAIGCIKSGSSSTLGLHSYYGQRSWSRGYFCSTVGIDNDSVRRYVNTQGRGG
ncbi:MAG: IS200/IS605 family transposase [Bacteroidota bacterium]